MNSGLFECGNKRQFGVFFFFFSVDLRFRGWCMNLFVEKCNLSRVLELIWLN